MSGCHRQGVGLTPRPFTSHEEMRMKSRTLGRRRRCRRPAPLSASPGPSRRKRRRTLGRRRRCRRPAPSSATPGPSRRKKAAPMVVRPCGNRGNRRLPFFLRRYLTQGTILLEGREDPGGKGANRGGKLRRTWSGSPGGVSNLVRESGSVGPVREPYRQTHR